MNVNSNEWKELRIILRLSFKDQILFQTVDCLNEEARPLPVKKASTIQLFRDRVSFVAKKSFINEKIIMLMKRHLTNGALFTIWFQLHPLTWNRLKKKEIASHYNFVL